LFSVLNKYFTENNKLSNKDFYIFLGDYVDRGIENGLALKFVEKFIDKDNFSFLYGNHERHIMNHANNWLSPALEFSQRTLPQLYRAGFTKESMVKLFNKLEGTSYFKYGDKKILVSHAGFTTVPKKPFLLIDQMICSDMAVMGIMWIKCFLKMKTIKNGYRLTVTEINMV
jgi:Calcineurin-like phosphoesterase.